LFFSINYSENLSYLTSMSFCRCMQKKNMNIVLSLISYYIEYDIWQISCDQSRYHVISQNIMWLGKISCDQSRWHVIMQDIMWSAKISHDQSRYYLINQDIMWSVKISCDQSRYHVINQNIMWLVKISCDQPYICATFLKIYL
jgi:hypothetical protein